MVNNYETLLKQQFRRMLEMIAKIHRYTDAVSYDQFVKDEMRIDACVTALTQLGEIANIIKKQEYMPYVASLPVKEMTEMRNFLVHTYHKIDTLIIRKTIKESLPLLKKELTKLI